jgi:hypothetical protein
MLFCADITEIGCVLQSHVLGLLLWTVSEQCCLSYCYVLLEDCGADYGCRQYEGAL